MAPSTATAPTAQPFSAELTHSLSHAVPVPTPSAPPVPAVQCLRRSARQKCKTQTGLFAGNNNCFLNSILQQIIADGDLHAFLAAMDQWETLQHQPGERKEPVDAEKTATVCSELSKVVLAVRGGASVASLSALRTAIGLQGVSQEDCHEAMVGMLDGVHTRLKYHSEVWTCLFFSRPTMTLFVQAKFSLQDEAKEKLAEFTRCFVLFQRVSYVFFDMVDRDGSYYMRESLQQDTLLEGLQVDGGDLQKSLVALFSNSEVIDGDNSIVVDAEVLARHKAQNGSVLSGKQSALKTSKIQQLPDTVFVRLHRTGPNVTKHFSVRERVDFGSCGERKEGVTPKPVTLTLVGVVVHAGNTEDGGHYYSYIRHCNGQWWQFCLCC